MISTCAQNIIYDKDEYTEIWKKLWSVRDIAWHLSRRNPTLVKFESKLLNGKKKAKILFPFCGKVVDMKYYYDLGHYIYGIECSKDGIMDFFNEQNLEFTEHKMKNGLGYYYSTNDNRLVIYNVNFYKFDDEKINGKIECVWDRGAFGTITEVEQSYYINTMKKLLAPEFRYLLLVTEYDMLKFQGVPFSQPEKKIRKYFDWGNIEKLFSWTPEHLKLYQKHMKIPLEVKETTYIITNKNL